MCLDIGLLPLLLLWLILAVGDVGSSNSRVEPAEENNLRGVLFRLYSATAATADPSALGTSRTCTTAHALTRGCGCLPAHALMRGCGSLPPSKRGMLPPPAIDERSRCSTTDISSLDRTWDNR